VKFSERLARNDKTRKEKLKFAYVVTTYGRGSFLDVTLSHIPEDSRVMIIDTKEQDWALTKAWNHAADKLLWDEAYDAIIIMNDDVVLRPDTGELLAWAILEGQFENYNGLADYESRWPADHNKEILLLSARHAHWSDVCTDVPDWKMLKDATPRWEPGPDFSCFCISRRLGQEIGRFDEDYYPAYFEDNDTHRRIQLAGYEAGAFAPYWHFRNGTTRRDPVAAARVQATFENCKKYYCQKWGAPYDGGNPIGRETFKTPFGQ
jgi:hypothetical protein